MQPRIDNPWIIAAFYVVVAAAVAKTRFEVVELVALALMLALVLTIAFAAESGPYRRAKQSGLMAHITAFVLTFTIVAIADQVLRVRLLSAIAAAAIVLAAALALRVSRRKETIAHIRVSTLLSCGLACVAGGILSFVLPISLPAY
jgi:hypothetical protein